jgi:hypothetical protein
VQTQRSPFYIYSSGSHFSVLFGSFLVFLCVTLLEANCCTEDPLRYPHRYWSAKVPHSTPRIEPKTYRGSPLASNLSLRTPSSYVSVHTRNVLPFLHFSTIQYFHSLCSINPENLIKYKEKMCVYRDRLPNLQ